MLSNAKKILLYLCLDSRKRFLTDPVFTKSGNNWFPTRTVYPLSCSPLPPFPSYWGTLLPCTSTFLTGAKVPALGEKGGARPPRTGGCVSLEAGPGGKLLLPSCAVRVVVFLTMQEKELSLSEGAPSVTAHKEAS